MFNYTAFFNTLKEPLDDVKVRQALSYAIPYEDIIAIGANGRGTQSRGTVPAGVFPYSEDVKQYTYDIEKAKTLLKEAGHDGGGFSLKLTYASENSTEETFAPLIKDSFAQIGVDVIVEPMAFSEQWALAKTDPASKMHRISSSCSTGRPTPMLVQITCIACSTEEQNRPILMSQTSTCPTGRTINTMPLWMKLVL